MRKWFKKKEPELDPKELLPFCTRCHFVGAVYGDAPDNFCYMCGSGGTCVPMERGFIQDLQDSINVRIDHAISYGRSLGEED